MGQVSPLRRGSVEHIRNHPLVPQDIPVHGQVYDVRSGRLLDVA